jgi:hypothetical protein
VAMISPRKPQHSPEMTPDTSPATTPVDEEPLDDSPHAESSAQAARKVHWNLEKTKSNQGAMDARLIHRQDEDSRDAKHGRRRDAGHDRRRTKRNTRSVGNGLDRIDALNEVDRMDVHEEREERLRRRRREEMRAREKKREMMERKRDSERKREVAVESSEDSSLSDAMDEPSKKPCSGGENAGTSRLLTTCYQYQPLDAEADISAAAHAMDSSDDGTPDAAPGPAPATGFTQKDPERDAAEGEMKMKMRPPRKGSQGSESSETSSETEVQSEPERGNRPGGVLSALLSNYGSREDSRGGISGRLLRGHRRRRREMDDTEGDESDTDRRPRRRRRPSLQILRRRRRWDERSLFARKLSDAGTANDSGTEGSRSEESDEEDRPRHKHRRRYPGHSGRQNVDPSAPVQEQMVDHARGLASASSSRRSSQTTLTDTQPRRPSHDLAPHPSGTSDRSSLRTRDPRHWGDVRKARRAMKEDLNQPYIPAHRSGHNDATDPGSTLIVNQYWDSLLRFCRLRSRGMNTEEAERLGVQTGQYRTIAALIIATSGLVGPAAPRLAHFAPASGRDAETNKGQRKLAEYTNPREKDARSIMEMTEDARQEAQEMGVPLDGKEKVELANEALMQVDQERGKGKPLRGRRHQREIKITRHISDILERQEFIEHLAKALVK